jgi:two-component system sensor histidine kinase KdpD
MLSRYFFAILTVVCCTAISRLLQPAFTLSSVTLIFVFGVVLTAAKWGRGPSIVAALLSVAALDYYFCLPLYCFDISSSSDLLTLAVMLVVAVSISTLTIRVRHQALESVKLAEEAEIERLRSALLSSFSHDLRTPLATITGAATGLLETEPEKLSADQTELAKVIYEEAERLERFVANLLNMTRLEAGVIVVHKEFQPIEEVVGSALTRMEARLVDRTITTELAPKLPNVPIDAVLIEQVIINLIDNALKYTEKSDAIKVGSQEMDDDQIVVFVSDSGSGVPAGEEEKIFDKFYRAKPEGISGFGLGLSICKAIVQAHGGRIWIENNHPGACFKFSLPRKDAQLKGKESAINRATSYSH